MHVDVETPPITTAPPLPPEQLGGAEARTASAGAVLLGTAVTLAVQGYQFGQSNHTVYLLDAMRKASPGLLANDWFTTQTLQYHAIFGWLTSTLLRLGVLEAGFLAGYVALAALLHVAWHRLVRVAGGTVGAYLASVLAFYLLGAGTGLGMYQFLQDAAFLPSNIANVAMLWGVLLWVERRWAGAGVALGVAGLFHLNHALVAIGLWGAMSLWSWRGPRNSSADARATTDSGSNPRVVIPRCPEGSGLFRSEGARSLGAPRDDTGAGINPGSYYVLGTVGLLVLCGGNIALAMRAMLGHGGAIPLGEFVDLYVRLRHPHHYDPSAWPAWLWVAFALPLPFTLVVARGDDPARRSIGRFFLLFCGLLVVALLGAGLTYASERLVQMSLYRFSIYPKLIACIALGLAVAPDGRAGERGGPSRWPGLVAAGACGAIVVACLVRGPYLGLFRMPGDDPAYLAMCDWAADNTPADAVFLVPPDEQAFRLAARRAVVVNFKGVPQLSRELPAWRDRLAAVLDLPDLDSLPRGDFGTTLAAVRARYDALPAEHLVATARRFGARYVLATRPMDEVTGSALVHATESGTYFLYDLDGVPIP